MVNHRWPTTKHSSSELMDEGIRALTRADKLQAELEALLIDGLNSGQPEMLMDLDIARFEQIITASNGC